MFDGLRPEVEKLLNTAASDLPTAKADAGLLAAMSDAVSQSTFAPIPTPRRSALLGKILTAKAAAVVGALVLTGGVASAATGNLPDPAQDAASSAASVVGLNIPQSDERKVEEQKEHKEHPENHGKDVSGVARDKSGDGDGNHGTAVCEVASDGKCKPNADEDNSGPGNSADHRKDADKRNENSVKPTTTTTVEDSGGDSVDSDDSGTNAPGRSGGKGRSGDKPPSTDD